MGSINYEELAKNAAKGFEPLPEGPHEVEVTGCEPKISKNGRPMYKVEYTVTDGPHKGKKTIDHVTLVADKPYFFFNTMKNLGLDIDFFAQLPKDDDVESAARVCAALIGTRVTVTIKHTHDGDRTYGNVDKIAGNGKGKKVDGVPDVETISSGDVATVDASSTPPGLPPGL